MTPTDGPTGAEPDDLERSAASVIEALIAFPAPDLTGPQVAELAGASRDAADRMWRALGFPDIDDGELAFNSEDARALSLAVEGLSDLPDAAHGSALELVVNEARALSMLLGDVAEVEMEMLPKLLEIGVRQRAVRDAVANGLDESELGWLIGYVLRRQLLALARDREGATGTEAVGFVDLVGFTARVAKAGEGELRDLLQRFHGIAFDEIAESGGRAIKLIGDEVMFVAPSPEAAVTVARRLRLGSERSRLSEVRGGIAYGPLLRQGGDVYGSTVNLASRLTAAARPGQILVSDDTFCALGAPEGYRRCRLDLRGIGPVDAWSVVASTGADAAAS